MRRKVYPIVTAAVGASPVGRVLARVCDWAVHHLDAMAAQLPV